MDAFQISADGTKSGAVRDNILFSRMFSLDITLKDHTLHLPIMCGWHPVCLHCTTLPCVHTYINKPTCTHTRTHTPLLWWSDRWALPHLLHWPARVMVTRPWPSLWPLLDKLPPAALKESPLISQGVCVFDPLSAYMHARPFFLLVFLEESHRRFPLQFQYFNQICHSCAWAHEWHNITLHNMWRVDTTWHNITLQNPSSAQRDPR